MLNSKVIGILNKNFDNSITDGYGNYQIWISHMGRLLHAGEYDIVQ